VETPSLNGFIAGLKECGYGGPLTLELSSKCTLEQVLQTKKIVEGKLG
jgi:hypothetical protein